MKKLLIFILFFVALGACTPKIIVENQDLQGTIMINSFEKSFSNEQFDSIAFSDSIPNDLKKWPYKNMNSFTEIWTIID